MESKKGLRDDLTDVNTGVEDERARNARDLHDELGQALTGLKMDLAWLTRRQQESPYQNGAVKKPLRDMSHFIDATIDSMRRMATGLHPAALDSLGLSLVIETHTRQLAYRSGVMVFADMRHDLRLNSEQSIALLRIAQEALTNIVRHAKARAVWISLSNSTGYSELRIRDDGGGISSSEQVGVARSSGLAGMHERARMMGASLVIRDAPQRGTLVLARIPRAPQQD